MKTFRWIKLKIIKGILLNVKSFLKELRSTDRLVEKTITRTIANDIVFYLIRRAHVFNKFS